MQLADLVVREEAKDLKVTVVTWNFGQESGNTEMMKDNPDHFFSTIDT